MLQNMMRASMLDRSFYNVIERDSKYSGQAAMVVVVTSIAGAIGAALRPGNQPVISTAIAAVAAGIVGWLAFSLITTIVGTALEGDTNVGEMARVLGFAQAPMILSIVPVVGSIIGSALTLLASVVGIREANDFSTGKAILTGVIGWGVFVLIRGLLPFIV